MDAPEKTTPPPASGNAVDDRFILFPAVVTVPRRRGAKSVFQKIASGRRPRYDATPTTVTAVNILPRLPIFPTGTSVRFPASCPVAEQPRRTESSRRVSLSRMNAAVPLSDRSPAVSASPCGQFAFSVDSENRISTVENITDEKGRCDHTGAASAAGSPPTAASPRTSARTDSPGNGPRHCAAS